MIQHKCQLFTYSNDKLFSHAYSLTDISFSYKISRENRKNKNFIMKNNRRIRVRIRFVLFHSELSPTDPGCNILQNLLGRKKYEEEMSDKQSP